METCETTTDGLPCPATPEDKRRGLWTGRRLTLIHIAMFLGATLLLYGDVLFGRSATVLSKWGCDLSYYYLYLRSFGFGEMRHGNLPLWNPYLFCGMPHLGEPQTALFYPLNVQYLFLPLARAINWGIALHMWLLGCFLYAWARWRGIGAWSSLFAGLVLMFCGAHTAHVNGGHLSNLCAMAWAPLLLLVVEALFEERRMRWVFIGIPAAAMQILAGHPQYVYYMGITIAICVGFRLVGAKRPWVVLAQLALVGVGGIGLASIQFLPVLAAAKEGIRQGGLSYDFASLYSFPPGNFVTLIIPGFFGDNLHVEYWGRFTLWEVVAFMGITGLMLAVYGAICGDRRARRFAVAIIAVLVLLALGPHTPLYRPFYHFLPGYDMFRGCAKFMFFASLFAVLLAGAGLDRLFTERRHVLPLASIVLLVAIGTAVFAACIQAAAQSDSPDTWWASLMAKIEASGHVYPGRNPPTCSEAATFAAKGAWVAAGTCVAIGGLLVAARWWRMAVIALALLGVVEVWAAARYFRQDFPLESARVPGLDRLYQEHPGDYRVFVLQNPNYAMYVHRPDIWGKEPAVLRRYAEFMAFTQRRNPDTVNQYLPILAPHPLFRLLRCRYVVFLNLDRMKRLDLVEDQGLPEPMPRLNLISQCYVTPSRDDMFNIMARMAFDPTRLVLLEEQPFPAPVPGGETGTVQIVDSSTDHMTIAADLRAPAILLITDTYSADWRAEALPGSVQEYYDVMPADYAFQAVPLGAGKHSFRLEYAPPSFDWGWRITLVSAVLYLAGLGACWRAKRRRRARSEDVANSAIGDGATT